ncbi:Epidermal growth factor-binding protein type B [Entomophthora muscae]|uniref:Epidermal growth factor-binding protein type B n=1 Tax=Entomophthora muscae TaxID=34485 RepID=A0ACC2TQB7_9FUNG|nr:Epidermal growth factor-binding protein type B [Entomophthora muscae]
MFSIVGLFALSVAAWHNGRIVGGYAVTPESKYPWILSLALMGSHQCGGMAYSKDIVLTAAHCTIFDDDDWTVRFRHYSLEDKPMHEFKVVKRRRHPEYNHKKFDLNDIALWKIKGSFNLNTYVAIDKDSISNSEGRLLKVAGWGNLHEAEHGNNKLMEVQIPTFNIKKCVDGSLF